jgi:protein-S-isoprenylcysteine O-methyltransferase Ste14
VRYPPCVSPGIVIVGLWIAWALSWGLASRWTNATQKSVSLRGEVGYRAVTAVGALLLAVPAHGYDGMLRLWHIGLVGAWVCIAIEASGFAFCWWARLHLGRLWSSNVTRKEGHTVIDTGPYGLVRHPIYTGILTALTATAAAKGTLLGLLGAAILAGGLWMKARLEERWLTEELGEEAYGAYRRRVPMLVPFWPVASKR